MIIIVNGDRREIPAQATVQTLVAALRGSAEARGVAVAVGGEVVPRGEWPSTPLAEGMAVEIVTAVQGG